MMTFEGLRRHLEGLVGADNVWTDEAHTATHAVNGRRPRFVVIFSVSARRAAS